MKSCDVIQTLCFLNASILSTYMLSSERHVSASFAYRTWLISNINERKYWRDPYHFLWLTCEFFFQNARVRWGKWKKWSTYPCTWQEEQSMGWERKMCCYVNSRLNEITNLIRPTINQKNYWATLSSFIFFCFSELSLWIW